MRRKFISVLVVCLLLLFTMASCSLDSAFESLQGNKYFEWGWISVDIKNVSAVNDAINNTETVNDIFNNEGSSGSTNELTSDTLTKLGLGSVETAIKDIAGENVSVSITIPEEQKEIVDKGVLKAQSTEEKNSFNENITLSLQGAQRNAFVEDMKKASDKSDAAKGSMALTSAVITTLNDKINDEKINKVLNDLQSQLNAKASSDKELTQADVVQVQMITNLVSSAASAYAEIKDERDASSMLEKDSVKSLINDATVLADVTKALSGDIDLLTIPAIGDLISLMNTSSDGEDTPEVYSRRSLSAESLENELQDTEDDNWKIEGDWYVSPAADQDANDPEATADARKILSVTRSIITSVFGASEKNGVIQFSDLRTRINAMGSLVTAYDMMYSLVPADVEMINPADFSYIKDKGKASISSALDYILSGILSAVDRIFSMNELDLVDELNVFLEKNEWISKGVIEADTRIYVQTDVLEALGLMADGQIVGENDDDNSSITAVFENILTYGVDEVTEGNVPVIKNYLENKAALLDKMTTVGAFNVFDILEQLGVSNAEDDGSFTSFADAVSKMYEEFQKN